MPATPNPYRPRLGRILGVLLGILNLAALLAAAAAGGWLSWQVGLNELSAQNQEHWTMLRWSAVAAAWTLPLGAAAAAGLWLGLKPASEATDRLRRLLVATWLCGAALAVWATLHEARFSPRPLPLRAERLFSTAVVLGAVVLGLQPLGWLLRGAWRARPAALRGWPSFAVAAVAVAGLAWLLQPFAQRYQAIRRLAAAGQDLSFLGSASTVRGAAQIAWFRMADSVVCRGFDAATAADLAALDCISGVEIVDPRDPAAAWQWLSRFQHPIDAATLRGGDYSFVTPDDMATALPTLRYLETTDSRWRWDTFCASPAARFAKAPVRNLRWAPGQPGHRAQFQLLESAGTVAPADAAGTLDVETLHVDAEHLGGWLRVVVQPQPALAPGTATWLTPGLGHLVIDGRQLQDTDAALIAKLAPNVFNLQIATEIPPSAAVVRTMLGCPNLRHLTVASNTPDPKPELLAAVLALRRRGVTVRYDGLPLPP